MCQGNASELNLSRIKRDRGQRNGAKENKADAIIWNSIDYADCNKTGRLD